ncbi:fumarylacetoacetate hydrolase family protein [Leifsonia sp. NPDC056824]|uniref:fumarylacetoacetate hydrolase family protein n=1 Tax=Leifsonia sp. NPDC056824 TaxID=3345953 RepID=UPI0036A59A12
MHLYRSTDGRVIAHREDGHRLVPVASMAELLRLRSDELRTLLEGELAPTEPGTAAAPIDGRTEVWASGVTYLRSRSARMDESSDPDIYDRVYAAERPELFFKSAAWRVVTDGEPIAIREDSSWDVPEPELAVIANRHGEIVGYGVCDDVSSRSLEGENPLYLPQAKVFAGACAIGPAIRPAWEVDATALDIRLRVERDSRTLVDDATSTASLARPLTELVEFLFRAENFPDGAWLSTGTGIVPADDFTLRVGDRVTVEVEDVSSVTNPVAQGRASWDFLEGR